MGWLSEGDYQREQEYRRAHAVTRAQGSYESGAYVVRGGFGIKDLLKAAGFTYYSPDRTWRRAMTAAEYEAFDDATIGMMRPATRGGLKLPKTVTVEAGR